MLYPTDQQVEEWFDRGQPAGDDPSMIAWAIAMNINAYLAMQPLSAARIGEMLAALEFVKAEYIRRVLVPYSSGLLTRGAADPLETPSDAAFQDWFDAMRARFSEEGEDLGVTAAWTSEEEVPPPTKDEDETLGQGNPFPFPFPGEN
jgi:hypothetical protein